MADVRSMAIRRGAKSFVRLLHRIRAKAQADHEAGYREHPELSKGITDLSDYRAIIDMVRESVLENMNHPDVAHQEGYLRAVADLLCINIDGCGIDPTTAKWDPIKATARAFAEVRRA